MTRRPRTIAGISCGVLVCVGALVAPAVPAVAAPVDLTSVTIVSETGAFIGQSEARTFSPANGGTVSLSGDASDLELSVDEHVVGDRSGLYRLRLAAPLGEVLQSGRTYEATERYPQEDAAALDVSGNGRGCNDSLGRLVVLDIAHRGSTVDRLHALFEQHCEGGEAAVFGEIRYRVPGGDPDLLTAPGTVTWPLTHSDTPARPVPVTVVNTGDAPVRFATPELSGEGASSFHVLHDGCSSTLAVGQSCEVHVRFVPVSAGSHSAVLTVADTTGAHRRSTALSGVAVPGTTTWQVRSDRGDPIGAGDSHDWTPANAVINAGGEARYVVVSADSADGDYAAVFASGSEEALRPGTYERATAYFGSGSGPRLSVVRADRRCEASIGSFTVHEAAFSGDRLERFSASFEQRCEGADAGLRGMVRFRATPTGESPSTWPAAGSARPAPGGSTAPPAGAEPEGTTAVRLRSEPGDPFLKGESRDWTPADARIEAGGREAYVRFDIDTQDDRFMAEFLPGRNDVMLPGWTHQRARRAGFNVPYPGVWISGGGVGCNTVLGSFTVHEIAYDRGGLQRFSASFTQRCEGAEAALHGTVAYRALQPPPMPVRFSDIAGDVHERNIVLAAGERIAAGYPDGTYRPGLSVTRGQLATFLSRALDLPPAGPAGFSDTGGHVHGEAIDAVVAAGIASGYGDGSYRPDLAVSRAQMATFLTRALDLPPGSSGRFSDTVGDVHEAAIDSVAAKGIATGYGDRTYGPGNPVTRAQMATFLVRGLELDGSD
jgi:hypothetical protein